ncbi:hypothetical protein L2Y90_21650 [Burkholderia pyrrocinia]|uniref:hypothetical protein n=1 Tax=Burkholderia pyrrocinia TaxID=60550 RepID=UPI00215AFE3C|nr:hypothetical protein [Burkholderia pyrrocinia]UVE69344.1 hypothetical protein L2Y90_21650 [Burkholderia pyrrocinia]
MKEIDKHPSNGPGGSVAGRESRASTQETITSTVVRGRGDQATSSENRKLQNGIDVAAARQADIQGARFQMPLSFVNQADVVSSSAIKGTYGADTGIATNAMATAASASRAASSLSISKRYNNKVKEMLNIDVSEFNAALKGAGGKKASELEQSSERKYDPTTPENHILTKVAGQWAYDRQKLGRIARDDSHPASEHARDVLTAMGIAENQGKRGRGALYQTVSSAVGLTASVTAAAASHGAIAPAAIAGGALSGAKGGFDIKKIYLESRQNMRDAKAGEMQRHVNLTASDFEKNGMEKYENDVKERQVESGNIQGENVAPLTPEQLSGVYASMYDNARRAVADQKIFGNPFKSGRSIDDRKAGIYKGADRDLVAKHVSKLVANGVSSASDNSLNNIAKADTTLGLSRSKRKEMALQHIATDKNLAQAHNLLMDTGLRRGEAALLLAKMGDAVRLTKAATQSDVPSDPVPQAKAEEPKEKALTDAERRNKIADILGQPGLKAPDPGKDVESLVKKYLVLRS